MYENLFNKKFEILEEDLNFEFDFKNLFFMVMKEIKDYIKCLSVFDKSLNSPDCDL